MYKKLFRPSISGHSVCIQIHANHYGCSLEHILAMVNELRKDFYVEDKDIQVQKYGGRHKKGVAFVEAFFPAETKMPTGYEEIHETDFIL